MLHAIIDGKTVDVALLPRDDAAALCTKIMTSQGWVAIGLILDGDEITKVEILEKDNVLDASNSDEDDLSNHPIDCTCIYCIPGA